MSSLSWRSCLLRTQRPFTPWGEGGCGWPACVKESRSRLLLHPVPGSKWPCRCQGGTEAAGPPPPKVLFAAAVASGPRHLHERPALPSSGRRTSWEGANAAKWLLL